MTITLNENTCMSILACGTSASNDLSWYIKNPTTLLTNQSESIIFQYDTAGKTTSTVKITTGLETAHMVFLTFFGTSVENGVTKPYGQTIPFEAVVPI